MFSIETGLGFVISGIVFQKFGFRSFLSHFVHPTLVHPTSLGRATQIIVIVINEDNDVEHASSPSKLSVTHWTVRSNAYNKVILKIKAKTKLL